MICELLRSLAQGTRGRARQDPPRGARGRASPTNIKGAGDIIENTVSATEEAMSGKNEISKYARGKNPQSQPHNH